jgi:hypothetical protein
MLGRRSGESRCRAWCLRAVVVVGHGFSLLFGRCSCVWLVVTTAQTPRQ